MRPTYRHPQGPALLLGLLTGLGAYLTAYVLGASPLLYLPVEGVWTTDEPAATISMSYYGLLLTGAAGYLVGWAAGRLPAVHERLLRPSLAAWLRRLVLGATLLALAVPIALEA